MNYNRATVGTMQMWAHAVNDSSYTWDNFLPYYQRSVNYTAPDMSIRASNSTVPKLQSPNETGGPLQLSFPHWATPLASWAQLAFRELGVQDVPSLIEGQLIGSQYSPLTLDPTDQSRSSSQTAYQQAALDSGRQNLKIYTHSLAKRVLFDQNKTATGVVVKSGPAPVDYVLSAKEEVILSAGAFQSPQLLMVSGVGPAAQLAAHNICVVADRPGVGQNMWDHVVLSVGRQVDVATYGQLMNTTLAAEAERAYRNGTGILTNDQSDYLGWEKLPSSYRTAFTAATRQDLSEFPDDWPEIEYEISSAPFGTPSFSTPQNPIDVGYIQPILIAPLSRGNVSISSADMSDPPIINPNWLTHPTDQQVAVAALKRSRDIWNATSFDPIRMRGEELTPGPDLPSDDDDDDDEVILRFLQLHVGFNWHASCTCKMGRGGDVMAVVDSRARVFGVGGLRVVDASAFAVLPPGHPQGMVYALAEKIAGDVLSSGAGGD
jgi:choline dehydrogenase